MKIELVWCFRLPRFSIPRAGVLIANGLTNNGFRKHQPMLVCVCVCESLLVNNTILMKIKIIIIILFLSIEFGCFALAHYVPTLRATLSIQCAW